MGYGDHTVWAPEKRWKLFAVYWAVGFVLAWTRGLQSEILKLDVKTPDHWMYFVSFIGFIPIFMAAYDVSAYAFNRKLSIFSTIVWPLGHINDTLLWYFFFDCGRAFVAYYGKRLIWMEPPMWWTFIGGWAAYGAFMSIHRGTLELWYMPEHHPPKYARGNSLYIFIGLLNSIPMFWIYHYKDDMLWGFVLKYAFDLWLSMRIRIPDPFDPGNSEKEADTPENKKYWDQFWLPSPNY